MPIQSISSVLRGTNSQKKGRDSKPKNPMDLWRNFVTNEEVYLRIGLRASQTSLAKKTGVL